MRVDHSDHVGCVFSDEMEKLFPLKEPAPDALQLQMLIDGVNVEQQDKSSQPSYPLLQVPGIDVVTGQVKAGECQRKDAERQNQSDGYSESPKPPFPTLHAAVGDWSMLCAESGLKLVGH